MKNSQKNTIKNILIKKGKVNNYDAIMKLGIWRLSDIILHLRREGMDIKGDFMVKNKKVTKIFEYKLNG